VAVAWKSQRRECIERKDADLEHLGARAEALAVREPRAERKPDHARRVLLGDVVDADEPSDLDRCADLLQALAPGGVGGVLVVVDESSRQTPQAVARLDGPPAEDDAAVRLDDDRRGDLRVPPQDEVVVGAGL
jgi:hypothetical protein